MQHSAPVPENPRSNTSPGPVPESGTGAGRTFNSQNLEVIINRLRCSMVEVARKRKKSVSMACATNAPRKHKSTTILNRNGSQGYPPKVYGLLQNSKICRQARSLASTPSQPPLCLALNSAKFLRSAAFQDLKCLFGQASFQEFKCFRLRFASPASRAPKKFTTQAYFRLSSAEPRNSKRQQKLFGSPILMSASMALPLSGLLHALATSHTKFPRVDPSC